MQSARIRALIFLPLAVLLAAPSARAQTITTPQQQFGHNIGDDYWLANYTQFSAYWEKLAAESDRMVLDTIGTTAEGRPQLMAIITSPANHARLDHYKTIAQRLARAEGLSDAQARALADEGKAVVWIDGGLHATEVLGAHQLMETVYQLVSMNDDETRRFLDDIIILAVHANPDGMELVSDWYMRESDPTRRSTGGIPRLYQKYVGHDNNRDFYASTQPESENMNRVMYTEWYPQIMYNHHQTGPEGTVMFAPPFRDPFNYNLDPLIPAGLDLIGAAMQQRFIEEEKPGVTNRLGANYSTWWNGGLRTTAYFHNILGLLTETIGNPTPMDIPLIPRRQLPKNELPMPIAPQRWHFRNSVDYSVTANRAVLDLASRRRAEFLYNIYAMGRNSIERGNQDTWTVWPRDIAAVDSALSGASGENNRGPRGNAEDFARLLRRPEARDPRGYIIPSDQRDFLTAIKFVDALLETGVTVHRATSAFSVNGKQYPEGSFVVKTAQAFRPHILDMFEPQDHPDDIPYPGGPPTPPYDVAGWTLAYQMDVDFDRILEGFDGPFVEVEGLRAEIPAGRVAQSRSGWFLSHAVNDAFVAVNRLLAAGEEVRWLQAPVTVGRTSYDAGTFFIRAGRNTRATLERLARERGLVFEAAPSAPRVASIRLEPVRIGLVDRYGGSMPSGWTRWIFEQFEFPFEVVYPRTLDAGDLNERYDVLVFVDGMIPETEREGQGGGGGFGNFDESRVPAELQPTLGAITIDTTVPRIQEFMRNGGTVIAIGSSTALAEHIDLPVHDALVEVAADGTERHLPRARFYVPGSVLEARVDVTHPLAHGLQERTDFFYDNSPVFRLEGGVNSVRPVAWFDSAAPLRSGWAWGQNFLQNGVLVAEADVGEGKLFLFGPEVAFRAQPHGTFKFLFNGIYYGPNARD